MKFAIRKLVLRPAKDEPEKTAAKVPFKRCLSYKNCLNTTHNSFWARDGGAGNLCFKDNNYLSFYSPLTN